MRVQGLRVSVPWGALGKVVALRVCERVRAGPGPGQGRARAGPGSSRPGHSGSFGPCRAGPEVGWAVSSEGEREWVSGYWVCDRLVGKKSRALVWARSGEREYW